MYCPKCGKSIPEVFEVCTTCGFSVIAPAAGGGDRWPTAPINIAEARDPNEKTAMILQILFAVPAWLYLLVIGLLLIVKSKGVAIIPILLIVGFTVAFRYLIGAFVLAYIRVNGVRVSARQFPDLDAAAENFCSRLGLPHREIYVMQASVWNAFAAKLAGKRVVVLLSGAIDSIIIGGKREDLAFLLGHELGHHALGHLEWWQSLLAMGNWMMWISMWYRRRKESSCDRIGLACTRDVKLCTRALVNMTVGAKLAAETNVDAVLEQWHSNKNDIFVMYRTLYSWYPHNLGRIANIIESGKQFGL